MYDYVVCMQDLKSSQVFDVELTADSKDDAVEIVRREYDFACIVSVNDAGEMAV